MTGVDRTRLPDVGADPPFRLPEVVHHRLSNGLAVRTVEHDDVPVVTFLIVIEGGSGADPRRQEGLAAITADMVDEGTGTLSAIQVSDRIARVGGQYDLEVSADATFVSLTALSRFAARGAGLLADLVVRPSLREDDFARVRQLRLDRLRQLKDVAPTVAERAFLRLLYGEHAYGHLAIGTDAALRGLSLDDVASCHGRHWRPSRATVVAVGALPHRELLGVVEQAFGAWDGQPRPVSETVPPLDVSAVRGASSAPRIALVPRAGAAQSELRIGHLTTGRATPDYSALLVMNAILGGQFVSRVNLKLREEKGFTYGARTGFDWRRGATPFALSASVHTAATAEAIQDGIAELEGIRGGRPITTAELSLAKASLTRGYPRNFETAQQIARGLSQLILFDLPDTYFSQFVARTQAVTAQDVSAAAITHLDPGTLTTLVVGDQAAVGESLEHLGRGAVHVLPAD